jgi:hypothetical protein
MDIMDIGVTFNCPHCGTLIDYKMGGLPDVAAVTAERDALLEALRGLMNYVSEDTEMPLWAYKGIYRGYFCEMCGISDEGQGWENMVHVDDCPITKARAAIAKIEEGE